MSESWSPRRGIWRSRDVRVEGNILRSGSRRPIPGCSKVAAFRFPEPMASASAAAALENTSTVSFTVKREDGDPNSCDAASAGSVWILAGLMPRHVAIFRTTSRACSTRSSWLRRSRTLALARSIHVDTPRQGEPHSRRDSGRRRRPPERPLPRPQWSRRFRRCRSGFRLRRQTAPLGGPTRKGDSVPCDQAERDPQDCGQPRREPGDGAHHRSNGKAVSTGQAVEGGRTLRRKLWPIPRFPPPCEGDCIGLA